MNEWLDRGFFATVWVAVMWIGDLLTTNTGVMSYGAMMVGAVTLVIIGLIRQYWARVTE